MEQIPFLALAIIGATQFIKLVFARNYERAAIIVGAVAIGALCGAFEFAGVKNIELGITAALIGTGVYTTAQATRGTATAAPRR